MPAAAALSAALSAGLAYGGAVFALGFVLGALREIVLAPLIGRSAVVILETPLILAAAWFLCLALLHRMSVPADAPHRLAMGGVAFALLILGEAAVAIFGFGRPLGAHLAAYATARGAIELAPQILFALFPLIALKFELRRHV